MDCHWAGNCMKRWLIAALLVLLVVVAYYLVSRPDKVVVTLLEVDRGAVEQSVANTRAGTVEACQRARLTMPMGGQISQLLVTEGDSVEQGQLLMTLWNLDRAARLSEARAAQGSAVAER